MNKNMMFHVIHTNRVSILRRKEKIRYLETFEKCMNREKKKKEKKEKFLKYCLQDEKCRYN